MKFISTYGVSTSKSGKEVVYADKDKRIVRCNTCMSYYIELQSTPFDSDGDCQYCPVRNSIHKVGAHQKYGKLRSIAKIYLNKKRAGLFLCDCGNKVVRDYSGAFCGYSLSCGCLEDKYNFEFKGTIEPLVYTVSEVLANDKIVVDYILSVLDSKPCKVSAVQEEFDSSSANVFGAILNSEQVVESCKKKDEEPVEVDDLDISFAEVSISNDTELTCSDSNESSSLIVISSEDFSLFTLFLQAGVVSVVTKEDLFNIMLLYGDDIKTTKIYNELMVINENGTSEHLYSLKCNGKLIGCMYSDNGSYELYGDELVEYLVGCKKEICKLIASYNK